VIALSLVSAPAWGWGGAGHRAVARAVPSRYPPEMAAFQRLDSLWQPRVMDADRRKSDPALPLERFRHFIDVDAYPEFRRDGSLPSTLNRLVGRYGWDTVARRGLLPWAIDSTVEALAGAMRGRHWSLVPGLVADLCHYCADLTQPLHCTQNEDGERTGQRGIHARYESELLARHESELDLRAGRPLRVDSVRDAAVEQAEAGQRASESLLAHDRAAGSSGVGTPAYYDRLWALEGAATRERLARAADLTASFLWTAWRRAGNPTPPGPGHSRATGK
jgi:hypothetical protein